MKTCIERWSWGWAKSKIKGGSDGVSLDAKCTMVFIVSESCGIDIIMTITQEYRSYQKWSSGPILVAKNGLPLQKVVLAYQDTRHKFGNQNWSEVQLLATKIGPLYSLGIANKFAAFPGSIVWVETKEPCTHCLHIHSSPMILSQKGTVLPLLGHINTYHFSAGQFLGSVSRQVAPMYPEQSPLGSRMCSWLNTISGRQEFRLVIITLYTTCLSSYQNWTVLLNKVCWAKTAGIVESCPVLSLQWPLCMCYVTVQGCRQEGGWGGLKPPQILTHVTLLQKKQQRKKNSFQVISMQFYIQKIEAQI